MSSSPRSRVANVQESTVLLQPQAFDSIFLIFPGAGVGLSFVLHDAMAGKI